MILFIELVVILVYFTSAFSDVQDSWDMVAKKARKWLNKEAKNLNVENIDFMEPAKKLLRDVKLVK